MEINKVPIDKALLRKLLESKKEHPTEYRRQMDVLVKRLEEKVKAGETLTKIEQIILEAGKKIVKIKPPIKPPIIEPPEVVEIPKIPPKVRIAAIREALEEEIPYEEKRKELDRWLWQYKFFYEDDLKEAQERVAEEKYGMPFDALSLPVAREVSGEAKTDLEFEDKVWFRNSNLEKELWGKFRFAMYKPTPTNYWWLWENDPEGFERDKGWFSSPYCLLYQRLIVEKTLTYREIEDITGIPSYVINTYIDKCREERIARGLPVEV